MEATIYALGFRVSQKYGYLFRGPQDKDYSISGVYLGVPLFEETAKSPYHLNTLPIIELWHFVGGISGEGREVDVLLGSDCSRLH